MVEELENEVEDVKDVNEMTMKEMCFTLAEAAVSNWNPNSFSLEDVLNAFIKAVESLDQEAGPLAVAEETEPVMSPEDAIQATYVVCLECGAQFKQLTKKHLASHGLTVNEYKAKWGYKKRQSLVCKNVSKKRSKAAKERGLPAALVEFQQKRKDAKEGKGETEKATPAPRKRASEKAKETEKPPRRRAAMVS